MIHLCFFMLSYNHGWLNRESSKSIVKKYSPKQVNGNIFSSVGVNNYVKSILLLSDDTKNRNAIVQLKNEKMNVLIFTEDENICIDAFLWSPNLSKQACIYEFLLYLSTYEKSITYSCDLDDLEKSYLSLF